MVPSGLLDGCGVIRIAVQRIDELSETCHHLAKGARSCWQDQFISCIPMLLGGFVFEHIFQSYLFGTGMMMMMMMIVKRS